MAAPLLSVVMASKNRPLLLQRTLESIRRQRPSFPYEILVVDDGSVGTETAEVCRQHDARYFRTERHEYTNPGYARNIGYRAARAPLIVAQSDDTYHETSDALERLSRCPPGEIHIATVWELDEQGGRKSQYTGPLCTRPFFFLGSLWRSDLYAVGGDDEDFNLPGFDDDWLAARLVYGRKLRPVFRTDVTGCHQWHERPPMAQGIEWAGKMGALYSHKVKIAQATGAWVSASGSWPYQECA